VRHEVDPNVDSPLVAAPDQRDHITTVTKGEVMAKNMLRYAPRLDSSDYRDIEGATENPYWLLLDVDFVERKLAEVPAAYATVLSKLRGLRQTE
jgi:hypothetical protein